VTPDPRDAERIAELAVAATAAAAAGHPIDAGAEADPIARRVAAVVEAIAGARPAPDQR
jgi:hypothetical protein